MLSLNMQELHRKIVIIYNPAAGKGKGLKYATKLAAELGRLGIEIAQVFRSDSLEAMREFHAANTGNKHSFSLAVLIGGDGTIGPNVDAMIKCGADVPIYPFGRGTANDFSSALKTNVSVRKVAKIIAEGSILEVDTLKTEAPGNVLGVNYAVNNAAGGAFTNGVTNYKGKKVFGKLAYIVTAALHALRMKAQKMRFTVDGESFEETVFLFYILNTKNAGGIKGAGSKASPSDGLLDLVCIRKCGLWGKLCVGLSALCGCIHKSKRVKYIQGKTFRAEVVGSRIHNFTKTDTDGNPGGDYPLEVQVGPKIQVVCRKI